MKYYSEDTARSKGADMQLICWCRDDNKERKFIEQTAKHILKYNKNRIVVPVEKGGLITLFVDNITKSK